MQPYCLWNKLPVLVSRCLRLPRIPWSNDDSTSYVYRQYKDTHEAIVESMGESRSYLRIGKHSGVYQDISCDSLYKYV
jgi:hypothetical protein